MKIITSNLDQLLSISSIADNLCHLILSQRTNFRLFQNEKICRQQFKIWWNGREFSKRVENTLGKQ